MVLFFRNFASGGSRGVACNAPTIDVLIDLLITMIPCIWSGITTNASRPIDGK